MKNNQVHIFATRADFEPGIRLIASRRPLQYVLSGLFDVPEILSYKSATLLENPSFGLNFSGSHVIGDQYLVMDASFEPRVRVVPQRRGGTKYAVDSLDNPDSILFRPSGIFDKTNLVCGHIWRGSENMTSTELYKFFTTTITKGFQSVGSYLVGPEALQLMRKGVRMVTIGVRTPREYDLDPLKIEMLFDTPKST